MIDVSGLRFQYAGDEPASFTLNIDRFTVPSGQRTALVGPSGSGKTTLLGLIAGTLRPEAGTIHIDDTATTDLNEGELGAFRVRRVGQVFQAFELLGYLSVIDNILLPWYIVGDGPKPEARRRAEELLASVGLAGRADSRPASLSQGEQQRVAVCRAMLNNPAVLLADEPTGNLDQRNKRNVVDLLVEQAQKNESTLLMVTHDEALLDSFDAVLDIRDVTSSEALA